MSAFFLFFLPIESIFLEVSGDGENPTKWSGRS